jgi:hypothetical protein
MIEKKHNPFKMRDFRNIDSEAIARANALAGNQGEALKYIQYADETGQAISNDEDKSIFLGDFNSGSWYGLK